MGGTQAVKYNSVRVLWVSRSDTVVCIVGSPGYGGLRKEAGQLLHPQPQNTFHICSSFYLASLLIDFISTVLINGVGISSLDKEGKSFSTSDRLAMGGKKLCAVPS